MKFLVSLGLLLLSLNIFSVSHYYPAEYEAGLTKNVWSQDTLKDNLFKLLALKHIAKTGKRDVLSSTCTGEGSCYYHRSLGYRAARTVLFGKLHLEQDRNGYYVKDVYCRKEVRGNGVGPSRIPNSTVINTEHTWPQSKFTPNFPKGLQKSDLHHLYPTDSRANSSRGNHDYADISGGEINNCEASHSTRSAFEPPAEHKGNVARALFYFSMRYRIRITDRQEAYLRQWHILDPVDAHEVERNNMIHKVQGNRNPFIDFPRLTDKIRNF